MNNKKTYAIVNPSAIGTIVAMLLIIASQFNLIRQKDDIDILFYFVVVLLGFGFAVLIISIVRTYVMTHSEMRIDDDSIHIRGRVIRADEIKMIMIYNNKKQVIGIKPKGKLIVPLYLCYRYMKDQDDGIRELESWAQRKQIMLKRGSFTRWM